MAIYLINITYGQNTLSLTLINLIYFFIIVLFDFSKIHIPVIKLIFQMTSWRQKKRSSKLYIHSFLAQVSYISERMVIVKLGSLSITASLQNTVYPVQHGLRDFFTVR